MHGLSPEEEIDYWRERAQRAEREAQRYAWAMPAANVTRPAGCRCDLWTQGYCRQGCPATTWKPSEVWREEVADEVAEQIAQWLEQWEPPHSLRRDWGVQNPGEDMTVAHTLEMAAQQLRANAWKEPK